MSSYRYPFYFNEGVASQINGSVELNDSVSYPIAQKENGLYREGKITLTNGKKLDLVAYHNSSTENFIYLRQSAIDQNLLNLIGIENPIPRSIKKLTLPGQLCLGSDRTNLIGAAVREIFKSPLFSSVFEKQAQQNVAVFPIAREGLKYQVADAIFANFGFYCDEIILDAHHVFDSSVPIYNRSVEMTIFKDKDLDLHQKEEVTVAFFADSIASGLVMKEVIARVKERFVNLQRVEIIAPLATIRGLCRIACSEIAQELPVRVHVFETLLNALPPDYYYSAHFNIPELHIRPDLEERYRAWWGKDDSGNDIADTACAGYGWSEVFFSPRKQIQMMNSQLLARHQMSIANIVARNIDK